MIAGRTDTWYTVPEFAAMVGRAEKTLRNWAADGRLVFVYLFGVPFISLTMVESLMDGRAEPSTAAGDAALRMIGRRDRAGRQTAPERHQRRARERPMVGESAGALLHPSEPPVRSPGP